MDRVVTWQQWLDANRERFTGGDAEFFNLIDWIYRGPIADISIKNERWLHFKLRWRARIAATPEGVAAPGSRWLGARGTSLEFPIDEFAEGQYLTSTPMDLGNGRVHFTSVYTSATLYPRGDTQLNRRDVKWFF